jgi:superfamily II DNA/RNA helicase
MQLEKILQKGTSHAITSLQGNLSQNKRDKAMKAFRNYDADVMVATDIAARGIDVNDVDLVVNYDIPRKTNSISIGSAGPAGSINPASPTPSSPQASEADQEIRSDDPLPNSGIRDR